VSVIEEVKQKTDIAEVIGRYTKLTKSGRTLKALCPFHSEKHASFFVYPEQQSWHCFGACNTGGDVFSFLMKKENMDFGEALRQLAEGAGVVIPVKDVARVDKDKREKLYHINTAAAQYFNGLLLNSPSAEIARKYIEKRGINRQSVADFQLGYSPSGWQDLKDYLSGRDYSEEEMLSAGLVIKKEAGRSHDRFHNMLVFPISNIKGNIIGFGGRVLDDSLPKYINSPQTQLFDKSSILYGLNLAATEIRHSEKVIIVEGYMDTITAHQNGFKNVVASMGTSVTEKQITSLKKLTRHVVFALDADAAGEEATLRSVQYENILGAEVKVALIPQGKDPDDIIKEDLNKWNELVKSAVPIVDFVFEQAAGGLDLTAADGKTNLADKLLPVIIQIKDVFRQTHYLNKLAQLVGVSQHKLEAAMGKYKSDKSFSQRNIPLGIPSSALKPALSNPREDYCLSLLLQYPELKAIPAEISPEYFENAENREILNALQNIEDISQVKNAIDSTLWEHLDKLHSVKLPENHLENNLSQCVLLLRLDYLRGIERKKRDVLSSEAALKGTKAELDKQEEQGTDNINRLRDVFIQKDRQHRG